MMDARITDGYFRRTIDMSGIERTFLVRPPSAQRTPSAMIIMLHGHSGSAERLIGRRTRAAPYRVWSAIADRAHLLLVAPDGLIGADGQRGWHDCRADNQTNPRTDDAEFLTNLAARLEREYQMLPGRVFIVGTSNGGQMALRMAIERPTLIKAAAGIVAAMPAQSNCAAPTTSVPVLLMNGTHDPLVPYEGGYITPGGGKRGSVLSTAASIAIWTRLANISSPPLVIRITGEGGIDRTTIFKEVYARSDGRPVVVLYRVEGGGHTEPSRSEIYGRIITRLLGLQSHAIEMADEVWKFFAAQL